MTDFKFKGLTNHEEWLIVTGGWWSGKKYPGGTLMPQPGRRSAAKLLRRGLVVEHEVTEVHRGLRLTVKEYEVPIGVHFAYCMSCEDKEARA